MLVLACSLGAEAARADDMRHRTEAYFDAENLWNGIYVGLGATGIGVGAALATRDDPGLKAAGYPVMAVGGIQLVIGIVYLALTPGWRREAEAQLAAGDLTPERERMESVEAGFVYYKISEGVVATTGLVLGAVGAARADDVLMGVGAGLGCAAMTQLTMEHITHDVAKEYLRALEAASSRRPSKPSKRKR
jgi:hypothetical protein